MLRRLYDWTMSFSANRHAMWALFFIAFVESSFFPIPPDILLLPMVLAARGNAWKIAAVCTIGSVLGGIAGYGIGFFLYESVGRPVLDFYGYGAKFEAFQALYNEWGAWIVAAGGLTPLPFKVITIASGVTGLDMVTFTIASVLSRGLRYYLIAALLWYFGAPIRTFIEKYLAWIVTGGFVLLLGGFVAIKFLI
ncbi:MAG: DedA family protein [Rhodospirillaceae bacterium]|nr:DedA family protein [Rhodospirillaceae bacterium]